LKQKPLVRGAKPNNGSFAEKWLPGLSWGVAIILLFLTAFLLMKRAEVVFSAAPTGGSGQGSATQVIPEGSTDTSTLPEFQNVSLTTVRREADAHTIIPSRPRSTVTEYTVQKGDSIFSISVKYKLKPETILWANYDLLDDNPNMEFHQRMGFYIPGLKTIRSMPLPVSTK
jgi:LysM domain